MERTSGHRAQYLVLGTLLLVSRCSSNNPAVECNPYSLKTRNCSHACEAPGACSCNEQYLRCVCKDPAASLLINGNCITKGTRAPSEQGTGSQCKNGELAATVLLVASTPPSPELSSADVTAGRPSSAMDSILHWCAASAVGVTFDKISLSETKLISNKAATVGLLFFDISFSLCAEAVQELVHGSVFETRFIEAWQSFAAFPVTSIRLLELKGHRDGSLDQVARVEEVKPLPQLHPSTGGSDKKEESAGPNIKELIWIGPALGVALLLLLCLTCRLCRTKYKNKDVPSPRHWGAVAPRGQGVEGLPLSPTGAHAVPAGPGGGSLASVNYDFNPSSEEGYIYVAAAGLEVSECLTVTKGDLFEAFARGEDWLYGRISSSGVFGYLPEPCVLWIDAIGSLTELREAGGSISNPNITVPADVAEGAVAPAGAPSRADVVGRAVAVERRE